MAGIMNDHMCTTTATENQTDAKIAASLDVEDRRI